MDHAISAQGQRCLLNRWKFLRDQGPIHYIKKERRSRTPALHIGVWHIYGSEPRITRETRDQSPEVIEAMDRLLEAIKRWVVPRVKNFLKNYCPHQWARQQR